jgi:hypothetical protein
MNGHRNRSPGKIDIVAVKQILPLQFTRTCDRCTQHTSKTRIFGSPSRNAASSRGNRKFEANDSLTARMAINTAKTPCGQAKRRILPLGNRRCRERIHVKNKSEYSPDVTRVTLDRKKIFLLLGRMSGSLIDISHYPGMKAIRIENVRTINTNYASTIAPHDSRLNLIVKLAHTRNKNTACHCWLVQQCSSHVTAGQASSGTHVHNVLQGILNKNAKASCGSSAGKADSSKERLIMLTVF